MQADTKPRQNLANARLHNSQPEAFSVLVVAGCRLQLLPLLPLLLYMRSRAL